MSYNKFIFGNDPLTHVVGIEPSDGELEIFTEPTPGHIVSEFRPHAYWALSPRREDASWEQLAGQNHFAYRKYFRKRWDMYDARRPDWHMCHDPKENALIDSGLTYFKGARVKDISVLSFDIETTGLVHDQTSRVLLISNTYRAGDQIEKRLFKYADHLSDAHMFDAWCQWVRSLNPSLMLGHNIYGYDLPYMGYCARRAGTELRLGRDNSPIRFATKPSQKRRDGSQQIEYTNAYIYGRELVDTMFLAINYDIGRKYESFALKKIIAQEGLEVAGREFYDASQIGKRYKEPAEWEKICRYAEHDADDALSLWDLMAPATFYLTQSVPRSIQQMVNSASGSQINSFLIRSYLAEGHSVPVASEAVEYEGAISIGNPGIYRNCFKVDVASMYPSIIRGERIQSTAKDPLGAFLRMMDWFTEQRLANKKLAKETGERTYQDLSEAQKVVINSGYGFLGAQGLNFNYPEGAAAVTKRGRETLTAAMDWAKLNEYPLAGADTDSILVADTDEADHDLIARALNGLTPWVRWEHDGNFPSVLVLKAKNYCLQKPDGTLKIKGSALRSSAKEKALREFSDRLIATLLASGDPASLYAEYVREAIGPLDITRWSQRMTVTSSVLNPQRTTEEKKLAAIDGANLQMGDKAWIFFRTDDSLAMAERWKGDHDPIRLLKKLHDTVKIFAPVLDVSRFPNYSLKKNVARIHELGRNSAESTTKC